VDDAGRSAEEARVEAAAVEVRTVDRGLTVVRPVEEGAVGGHRVGVELLAGARDEALIYAGPVEVRAPEVAGGAVGPVDVLAVD
jgi:hypothetical protein